MAAAADDDQRRRRVKVGAKAFGKLGVEDLSEARRQGVGCGEGWWNPFTKCHSGGLTQKIVSKYVHICFTSLKFTALCFGLLVTLHVLPPTENRGVIANQKSGDRFAIPHGCDVRDGG